VRAFAPNSLANRDKHQSRFRARRIAAVVMLLSSCQTVEPSMGLNSQIQKIVHRNSSLVMAKITGLKKLKRFSRKVRIVVSLSGHRTA
jgi:hypothetical protein